MYIDNGIPPRVIVEFNAYQDNNKHFIVKELAVVSIEQRSYIVLHFLPPYSLESLNKKSRHVVHWLENKFHRLAWSSGNLPYNEDIIYKTIKALNPSTILTKGLQKQQYLHRLFGYDGDTKVLNIETEGCPKPVTIDTSPLCPITEHNSGQQQGGEIKCALHIALHNAEWLTKPSTSPSTADFTREKDRLDTFLNWQVENAFSPSAKLAEYGFQYEGVKDALKCVWCGVTFSDFSVCTNVRDMHTRYSPQCPSIVGYVPNVPLALETIVPRVRSEGV